MPIIFCCIKIFWVLQNKIKKVRFIECVAEAQTLHPYKFFKSEVRRMDKKDKNTLIHLNNLIGEQSEN